MTRPVLLCAIAAMTCAATTIAVRAQPVGEPTVCLVPLGDVPQRELEVAKRGIGYLYGFHVSILARRSLPSAAFYKPRRRYRAEKLLADLDRHVVPTAGCTHVIALTAVDISTTKDDKRDWGIFGLASLGGPSGVVSSFRLRRRAKTRRMHMRLVKVVNHELGHALGVPHVAQRGCLMEDGAGTIRTVDRETGLLCRSSVEMIQSAHDITLPAHETFDWPRVLSSR